MAISCDLISKELEIFDFYLHIKMFQICGFCDFLNMKSKFSGLCKPHAGENAYLTGKMVWNRLFKSALSRTE